MPLVMTATYAFSVRARLNAYSGTAANNADIFGLIKSLIAMGYGVSLNASVIFLGPEYFLRTTWLSMGITVIIASNYYSKITLNSPSSIWRNRWTLGNPVVWWKTHRLMGRIGVACGLLLVLTSFTNSLKVFITVGVVVGLAHRVFPPLYSRSAYKRLHSKTQHGESRAKSR